MYGEKCFARLPAERWKIDSHRLSCMFSNRFFDFLKHPCADGIHRSTKGIYRLSGVKIKHLLEILMLEVVVGTFHEPAIHRIGYAVCHRIFESYFDVEFIILLKEAVGNDVEELLFVIVPILSRQCGSQAPFLSSEGSCNLQT